MSDCQCFNESTYDVIDKCMFSWACIHYCRLSFSLTFFHSENNMNCVDMNMDLQVKATAFCCWCEWQCHWKPICNTAEIKRTECISEQHQLYKLANLENTEQFRKTPDYKKWFCWLQYGLPTCVCVVWHLFRTRTPDPQSSLEHYISNSLWSPTPLPLLSPVASSGET